MQPKVKKPRSHIPEEIITLILERLPAKSLLRFMCVQKSWYDLIRSPLFVTVHSNCQKKYLLFGSVYIDHLGSTRIYSSSLSLRFDQVPCKEYYRIHQPSVEWYAAASYQPSVEWYAAASHGLICYSNTELEHDNYSQIWLWNPAIRKLKILPDPPPRLGGILWIRLAFGFCQKANDFRVVKIFKNDDYVKVEVYSLNTNSWKPNKKNLIWTNVMRTSEHNWVFLNASAYFEGESWSGESSSEPKPIIVSYDTDKDIMRQIASPAPETRNSYYFRHSIRVLHDSLVLFARNKEKNGFNMWVLKDEFYWEKKITVNLAAYDRRLLAVRSNGEVVLSKLSGNKLVSYNGDKDEGKDFAGSWDQWFEHEPGKHYQPKHPYLRVDSFSESLVLINS